ncbi:MarR family transcriptional regulator [Microtetraspora sp. AC03309]|uniref:winged helix DNA-binding protein n=1 Tax=Microtetraspora sp. AC03309 TaxID=2779376 RepID=UPI001E529B82|nr:winged helix DNA-binding protein [Microtetraspora sp. AC03309]MCC5577972.1 MarR family transcriptional regulator [Microtetraspora sp. AC03309]
MEKPVGYWIKHLDRLIEADFARVLAGEEMRRRHWQALNVLREGPADEGRLAEELRPFWGEGEISVGELLADLRRRRWITPGEPHALTEEGAAAHERVAGAVHASRSRIMDGLTVEQYQVTVHTLRTMAANLETAGR